MNQGKAREFCRSLGSEWDLPDGQSNTKDLTEFMQNENYNSTWILLQKHTYDNWYWVNGTVCKSCFSFLIMF